MQLTDEMTKMRKDGASFAEIAKRVGVAKSTVQKAFSHNCKSPSQDSKSDGDTLAVADVLAGYDAVGKVLALVKEIPAGRLRKDDSLKTEIGVGSERWRAIRGSMRVSGYVYQLPNKEYVWGSKSTIAGIPARLRELLA